MPRFKDGYAEARTQAKLLLAAFEDPAHPEHSESIRRLRDHPHLRLLSKEALRSEKTHVQLRHARSVVAQEWGFPSWETLKGALAPQESCSSELLQYGRYQLLSSDALISAESLIAAQLLTRGMNSVAANRQARLVCAFLQATQPELRVSTPTLNFLGSLFEENGAATLGEALALFEHEEEIELAMRYHVFLPSGESNPLVEERSGPAQYGISSHVAPLERPRYERELRRLLSFYGYSALLHPLLVNQGWLEPVSLEVSPKDGTLRENRHWRVRVERPDGTVVMDEGYFGPSSEQAKSVITDLALDAHGWDRYKVSVRLETPEEREAVNQRIREHNERVARGDFNNV